MTEMILTREEARRINGDNIRTVFGCALEDSILKRCDMYKEYDCVDLNGIYSPMPKFAVDIAAGYFIGSPCKYYVQTNTVVKKTSDVAGRPKMQFEDLPDKNPRDDAYLNRYRAIMRRNHEDKENMRLATSALICGTAYERIYASKRDGLIAPKFKPVDPRKAMLFHDQTIDRNPTAFIIREEYFSLVDNRKYETYELITDDRWTKYIFDGNVREEPATASEMALLKTCGIPIVEYPMPNREGYFEKVLPLVHARNAILNNVSNTFKYNDEAILLMIGYMQPETDEDEEELHERLSKFKTLYLGEDNKVEWLIKNVDIQSIQGYFDILTGDIYASLGQTNPTEIAEVYQNIQAVRYQNYGMDNTIIAYERNFEKGLLEGRAQKITALMNEGTANNYNWEVLDVAFSRNIPSSMTDEAQFMTQVKGSGLLSDKDILDMVSFVEDSEAAHQRKLEQDKQEANEIAEAMNVRVRGRTGEEPEENNNEGVSEN